MVGVGNWEHGGLCQEGSFNETCTISLIIILFFPWGKVIKFVFLSVFLSEAPGLN